MAYEQTEAFCNRCQRNTLHSRTTIDVPHVFHLLMVVLFCGLWLPMWLLHILVNGRLAQAPFLCDRCGEETGTWTGKRVASAERQEDNQEQQQQLRREEQAKRRAQALVKLNARLTRAAATIPTEINAALRGIAGEENKLLFRSLQVLIFAFPLLVAVVIMFTINF